MSPRSAWECGDDVGDFGARGVVGLDVDEAHDSVLVDDEHGGSGQADVTFGVHGRKIETELALHGEDVVSLRARS